MEFDFKIDEKVNSFIKFFVINLERRKDRLDNFIIRSKIFNLQAEVVKAVDSTNISESQYISADTSEYFGNLAIRATIESHVKVWNMIANSDLDYGVVFEDDILFSHHFGSIGKCINELKKLNGEFIVYLGTGDFLPVHTKPPNDSMLRAQERSHATIIPGFKYFGGINMKSAYVFNWLGAFSYLISKNTAKYLLELAKNKPINKAVDVWIKENVEKKYVIIPLMTWHPSISADNYDSDITPKN